MILGVDHIGFVVNNLKESIEFYNQIGFKLEKTFESPNDKGKAAYLSCGTSRIEIWQFENIECSLALIVKNHIGLETNNINEDIKNILANNGKLLMPITPGVTVKNKAFAKDENGTVWELIEK